MIMGMVEWRPVAPEDLLAIVEYISRDNPDAGLRLYVEIQDKVNLLRDHPKLYRIGRAVDARKMIVRSNYIVIYAETSGGIPVFRVVHAAREWPSS